ncbi:MerR family transcriptional regulator [Phytoactinopolyspora alkaliphila]|uniref:MerR family transcriptional regulator n=1 Tax=Phytoactinopolyspora alkaliphila TaxID=1783498 RepID=A0A6N9YS02_9ACTN|nr:MerR family transcriptional regulator [Phytoactinopolyspora alkaliphila]NED97836.1 MerR family transcriptional regulator [Phytoactinopolyspora alkaliphila]
MTSGRVDAHVDAPGGLRSGALAAAAGVGRETLRYYERRGLLARPERTLGGHRLYPPEAVTMVKIIKAAQRLGFTLDEVAALIDVGGHRHANPDLRSQAAAKLAETEARITDLTIIRDTLRAALDAGCRDLATCAEAPDCPLPFTEIASAT